ncbi:hypothetical protein [Flavobacterium wongokense]|uniref:hypothetical protein n=1 Tax=Flavobacterium wongokense TaxID=2910674 RepID=UPI001F1C8E09|nr:hypothetical protein [Flavobacterium sp. WG47]MCF6131956.1 hypothetical protein [Flavobacterium sp. WG47]
MKPNEVQEAFKIPSDWDVKAKLLRRRFPQLTSSDLEIDEKEDENSLLKRIEIRLNKKRNEVIEIIKNTIPNKFINNLKIQYHE